MRIVFMGTPAFAVPSLNAIVRANYDVALVVTSPDKPRRRQSDPPQPTPVKAASLSLGIPVYEVDDLLSPAFANTLQGYKPDVIVVVAFRILPKELFTIPQKGIFNLHASLLPKYRGAAPIQWAIINGERTTGVTTFFLEEKVDTGNMILQKELTILPNETGESLSMRLSELGAEAVVETLKQIESGHVNLQSQAGGVVTKAPKLTKENTKINWNKEPKAIHQFVCALSEKPAAWTTYEGKLVKIFKTNLPSQPEVLPSEPSVETQAVGRCRIQNDKLLVASAGGEIEILELQLEGKKRVTASEFIRGHKPTMFI